MECPRKAESHIGKNYTSEWRPDGTCSYCGSMSSGRLFEAIEAGCEVGPTDKDYKIYVDVPHPEAGKPCVLASANFPQTGPGWTQVTPESRATLPLDAGQREYFKDGHWVEVSTRGPIDHAKFYFQHLSQDERQRFVELYNAKKINIGYPGHFYVRPYFMVPVAG